tara:strand:- start:271 stop:567 length:297 start_codon:yes stop_codon:yes gene_type:complete
VHKVYVNDLVDSELLELLKMHNQEFLKLSKEELKEMVLIQSKLLGQLGLYSEDGVKQELVIVVPKEKVEVSKSTNHMVKNKDLKIKFKPMKHIHPIGF